MLRSARLAKPERRGIGWLHAGKGGLVGWAAGWASPKAAEGEAGATASCMTAAEGVGRGGFFDCSDRETLADAMLLLSSLKLRLGATSHSNTLKAVAVVRAGATSMMPSCAASSSA
eukprot:355442-Chlamydomonas_euryale.AAC.4